MSSRRTVTAVPLGANEDIGHVGYFKASIIDNTAQALKFDVILTFDDGPHHDIRLSVSVPLTARLTRRLIGRGPHISDVCTSVGGCS